MSAPNRTQEIAPKLYLRIMHNPIIRSAKTFALMCDEKSHRSILLVVKQDFNAPFGFRLVLPADIQHRERVAVIQVLRSYLEFDGYVPLKGVNMPPHFMHIGMDKIDATEANEAKTEEPSVAPDATKPADAAAAAAAEIDDHASFFRAVYLTQLQQQAVQEEMPSGASTSDMFVLSCFDADVLRDCGLSRVQIVAWEKRIGKLLA